MLASLAFAAVCATLSADRTAIVDAEGVMRWAEDGSEVAVFGVNYYTPFALDYRVIGERGFDRKDTIRRDVAHFRRLGFNGMRLHCFDREISTQDGALVDNDHLDLLDYLIAECASNGIYTVLTPIAAWGGGEWTQNTQGFATDVTMSRLTSDRALWKVMARYEEEFARHVNRYTGRRYADDPAILCFELINEPAYTNKAPAAEVAEFANALLDGIRRSGTKKPVFYSATWNNRNAAIPHLRTDGVTGVYYVTGLRAGGALPGLQLGRVRESSLKYDPRLARMSKVIYEFDAADMTGAYMYPAMAAVFRAEGVQAAMQFQYDATPIADDNVSYKTHYLNLVYTPEKAISMAIAAEVFRRTPRGTPYRPDGKEVTFPPFRVNAPCNLSEMVTEDALYYTATPKAPLGDMGKLRHVWGCGSSPVASSDGTGAYFLDRVDDGLWRLQIYPNVLPISDPYTGKKGKKTVVLSEKITLQLSLPDLGVGFSVCLLDGSPVASASNAKITVDPGDYVLLREAGLAPGRIMLARSAKIAPYCAPPSDPPGVYKAWAPSRPELAVPLESRPVHEPTLVLNSSGIAASRMRIATDPDAKAWWLGFKSEVDKMVSAAKPVPTTPGQSFNLYLCRHCGAGLERWRQDGRHICTRPSCRREHFGWPYDDVRAMREHYERIAECQDCAIAYLMSGDSRYAKRTIELLKTYAMRYDGWPVHDQNGAIDAPTQPTPRPKRIFGGHISAQILDECILAVKFARAYDAVRREMNDEDRCSIEEGLLRPLHKLALASSKSGWENHQLWHLSALGCLSFVLEDEPSARLAMDGPHGFRALLNHTVNADGMWNEGSWLYHFFSMRAMIPFFTAVVNRGGQIPLEFKAMFRAPFRQRTPDGCLPKVNDSARCDFRRGAMTELYEMAYAWWGDSDFGWWVGAKPRTTMEYALYGRPGTPETMMKEEPAALDATGLAFLRSPTKSCVMVNYDDYGGWHSHYDKLGLSLWGHGEALCEDPGCAPYASPLHWGWFRTSLAHSTLMADGKRQNHAQPLPNGKWPEVKAVRFRKFEDGAFVSVDGGSAVPDAKTGRMTMIRGDVVMDLVWGVSEKEREWELSFHSYGECSVSVERDVVPVLPSRRVVRDENGNLADGDGSDAWAWVEDAREGAHAGTWSATWNTGKVRLDFGRKDNMPGIVRTGTTPSIPSARLVSDRVRGKTAVYATVMVVSDVAAEPPKIDFGEISFDVEDPHSSCFTAVVNGKEYNIGD